MPLPRKAVILFWFLGFPLLMFGGLVVSAFVVPSQYATTQSAERVFEIEHDFTKVRKTLVRKDGAKQIIAMGGGSEFVEQQWDDGTASTESENLGAALLKNVVSSNPDWRLELNGVLKVRTKDDYIGEHVVTLDQRVEIVPDSLDSKVDLREPAERLLEYQMSTRFERDPESKTTRVRLSLLQEIMTHAPWFAHAYADRRVLESVEQTLANQETAIQEFIEENIGDAPVFPLR